MYLPNKSTAPTPLHPEPMPAQRNLLRTSKMISERKAIAALRASNLYINRNPFRSGGVCGRLDYFIGFLIVAVISFLGITGGGFLKVVDGVHSLSNEYGTAVLAVSIVFCILFNCALSVKRIRDIRGTSKNDTAMMLLVLLLQLIPFVNVITIFYLCAVRGRVTDEGNRDGRNSTGRELNEQLKSTSHNLHETTAGQLAGFFVLASAILAVCAGAALIVPHTHEALADYIHNSRLPRTGKFKARFALNKEGTTLMNTLQSELFDGSNNPQLKNSSLAAMTATFKPQTAPSYKNINADTWASHPEIQKTNGIVNAIRTTYAAGRYQIANQSFDYCSPSHDTKRQMAINNSDKTRFFSRSLGTLTAGITIDQYYDTAGTLRLIQAQVSSLNQNTGKSEYHVYFDENGKRLWEEKKLVEGSGPFPFTYWPKELTTLRAPQPTDIEKQNCQTDTLSH